MLVRMSFHVQALILYSYVGKNAVNSAACFALFPHFYCDFMSQKFDQVFDF